MPHSNEEPLRRGKEAFLRGDVDTVKELLADDFVLHTSGRGQFDREYRGRDAFFGYIRKVGELSAGTYRQELHDVAATDEHAIALVIVHAERNGRAIDYQNRTPLTLPPHRSANQGHPHPHRMARPQVAP